MNDRRIAAVDAARGVAMVLVCLSHIKQHFEISAPALHWFLGSTTKIATPTFLLLSGFVIGHLLRIDSRRSVRIMLIDRGLFLLLVAHAVLSLEDIASLGTISWLFGRVEITDAVGVALFVALLVSGASASWLALFGGVLCVVAWFTAMGVQPESDLGRLLGSIMFDIRDPRMPLTRIPIVPYVGAFMIGMALNASLMPNGRAITAADIARRLMVMAVAAILTVGVGIVAWHFGKGFVATAVSDPSMVDVWRSTLSPASKYPPSPAYFLFYGGAGLLILASFFRGQPRWLIERIKAPACTIGRASLMCYVAQDWLLFGIPHRLGFDEWTSVGFWFGYWVAVVLALYGLSRLWGAYNGNRLLTVGLKAIYRRRNRLRPPACLADTPPPAR